VFRRSNLEKKARAAGNPAVISHAFLPKPGDLRLPDFCRSKAMPSMAVFISHSLRAKCFAFLTSSFGFEGLRKLRIGKNSARSPQLTLRVEEKR
jgi:hypothetical protein